jgi:CRISPR-associated protein Csm4
MRHARGAAELDAFLKSYGEAPPLTISSCFPTSGTEMLLPMPLMDLPAAAGKEQVAKIKALRSLKYVDLETFRGFASGTLTPKSLMEAMKEEKEGHVTTKHAIGGKPIKGGCLSKTSFTLAQPTERAGNSVNRLSQSTDDAFFHRREFIFAEGTGFAALADVREEWKSSFLASLRLLEQRGLGGKMSSGKGGFSIRWEEAPALASGNGDRFVTLSLLHPTADELAYFKGNRDKVCYSLVGRKGVVENAYSHQANPWKSRMLCFGEGSVFPLMEGEASYGCNPVVNRESHPVVGYGTAFPIQGVFADAA